MDDFRKANICSKLFYNYAWVVIKAVNDNGGAVKEDMILDLTEKDGETER